MSAEPVVIVVDPYSSGALYPAALRAGGFDPVAVTSRPVPPEGLESSFRPQDFSAVLTFTGDAASLATRLRALDPVAVLPGSEPGVELAEQLGPQVVPQRCNVAELAASRRHKGAMGEAVAAAGLPAIPQICTDDPAAVEAWINRCGLDGRDLVVKPPKSGGTDSVTWVPGGRGWREAFDDLLGAVNRVGLVNETVLVQEHVHGTEYVVDAASIEGRHSITDSLVYTKTDNAGFTAVYDAMDWLSPEEADAAAPGGLFAFCRAVLDAVGLRTGTTHIEVMVTDRGPRLIEVGCRPHGGGMPRYNRVATGDSQIDRMARFLADPSTFVDGYELRRHQRVVFLIAPATGVVRGSDTFDGLASLASYHDAVLHLHDGARVHATRDLWTTFELGFVVLAHADRHQVLADYEAVRHMESQLVIEPGGESTPVPVGAR